VRKYILTVLMWKREEKRLLWRNWERNVILSAIWNKARLLLEVFQVGNLAYERTQCSDSYSIEICKFHCMSLVLTVLHSLGDCFIKVQIYCERYPTNAHKQFFIALISSPTCFGFQVPSSGCYYFLIYKLLQVVCIRSRWPHRTNNSPHLPDTQATWSSL
jgi:hypothetical protein